MKDPAGNTHGVAKEDEELPDFSYQTKYNMKNSVDKYGNYVADSILNETFLENLLNQTKSLVDNRVMPVRKQLPNGEFDAEDEELTQESLKALQVILDIYNKKDQLVSEPCNLTLKSIADKDTYDDNEKDFIKTVADQLGISSDVLVSNIKKTNIVSQIKCSSCGENMNIDDNFCAFCGTKKTLSCGNCGVDLRENSNFCSNCGSSIK